MGEIESEATATAAESYRFLATTVSAPWLGRLKVALALLAIMLITACGAWIGYKLTPQPVHEDVTPASQVVQADNSVIAARAPDAHPPAPRHMIPKGYVEQRRDEVTVAPSPDAAASGCPPVRVELSQIRKGDQVRVIASSPDGQVIAATDIPIEPALLPPAPRPWAAGLSYGTDRAVGVWLERDIGRLRLGAAVAKGSGRPKAELRVGVSW